MGIETVQIYGLTDENNSFINDADDAVYLEGTSLQETYLHIDKILSVAKSVGADAIHPGFGFLSENPEFAKSGLLQALHLSAPTSDVIALTGDKREAKKL